MDIDTDPKLSYFSRTGFFQEREAALTHLRDADEILTSEGVDYCLMFGTLLGLLRHEDFIPWDDDLDVVIFDIDKFEQRCVHKFEQRGYTVFKDIRKLRLFRAVPFLRIKRRCGYRIYSNNGDDIPGVSWKFPWLGVWEPIVKEGTMTLPPEEFIYRVDDFSPLQRRSFQGFSVLIPKSPIKILNAYFGVDDWMEYCIPSSLDHRHYKPTGFPPVKKPVEEVLRYLSKADPSTQPSRNPGCPE